MERAVLSLHPAQRDIYTDQLIDLTSSQYNIGGYIKLKGALNKELFHQAVNSAAKVFDVFKMRFDLHGDQSLCYFEQNYEKLGLEEFDYSDRANAKEEVIDWMQDRFNTPFPWQKDSLLFEHCLFKIAVDEYWFFGRYHHLITDGYGFIVFVQYVALKYNSLVTDDKLEFIYPSYQEEMIKANLNFNSPDYESDAAYWKEKITQKPQKFLQKKRQNIRGKNSSTYILNLREDQRKLLEEVQLLTKSGLQQLTIAALLIYFGKTSDLSEFIFGIPVHKRTSKRMRSIVGTFTGILPYKGVFQASQNLADFLKEIVASQRSDYRHQNYLIGDLTRHLKMNATEGYLSDIIVNYEPLNFELNFGDNVQASIARLTNDDERNPLKVVWRDYSTNQPLQLHIHFSNEYFGLGEIELLAQRLLFIIEQFPAKLDSYVGSIDILPVNERSLLEKFTETHVNFPKDKTIVDLFEAQVLKTPFLEAVLFGELALTYKEINERGNRLAHYLKSRGVQQETRVAVCIERSVEMIVAILGILKAGAAYLPIDSDYPAERIDYILEDSGVKMLLTGKNVGLNLSAADVNIIELDRDWEIISDSPANNPGIAIEPHHLAYVIYTSGSTGRPKGVMIEHGGVVNLSLSQLEALRLKPGMKTLQFASIGFDASCYEIFNTLLSGGTLVLCTKEDILSAEGFEDLVNRHQVELAVLPPSYQHIIIGHLGTIKTIVSAGEPLNETTGRHLQSEGIRLINAYGPTENTVCVSLTDDPIKGNNTIVIGKPLSNVQVYVLDKMDKLSPLGSIGELCVGGAQLARGYLNRPALTEEKFIKNPFSDDPGSRLYKTGDLGRWLPDGSIECLGRIDNQVKIRGYRIEPGEIEAVLLQSGLISQCVVLAKGEKDENKRLVGYVVVEDAMFDKEAIISWLHDHLPEYMVPALWVNLESIPVTANGKIDRNALPDPDVTATLINDFVAPQNEFEEKLAEIWQELLGVEKIGIHDNFFELGGDSIITIQVVSRVRQLGYGLEVGDVFTYPTISGLSRVTAEKSETNISGEQGLLTGISGLLPIQQWYLEKGNADVSHYNQSLLLLLDKAVTEPVLSAAVQQITAHHDALRFRFYQEEGHWRQEYSLAKGIVTTEDISSATQTSLDTLVDEIATTHQSSLDIQQGGLMRVVWIKTPAWEQKNRLLIVIHHLAVDGVSWRILLEDIERLINGISSGQHTVLGYKTSSYRQWYNTLLKYSNSNRLLSQTIYWRQVIKNYSPLRTDKEFNGEVKLKDIGKHIILLESGQTRKLLQDVPRIYHTEISDILLCALAKTICEWNFSNKVVIGLEGHGREHIEDGIDTSHTVGWFTTLFPVLLEIDRDKGLDELIKSVKEHLRQVPDKGLGYGVLKYLNNEQSLKGEEPWDMVFNYLGQFDNAVKEGALIGSVYSAISSISDEQLVSEKLSINSMAQAGELSFTWSYSRKHYNEETIKKIAEDYLSNLQLLITHCLQQKKSGMVYTPSDFGLGSIISYQELDNFLDQPFRGRPRKEQVDSLYRLSGLQHGVLFYGLYDSTSGTYISQFGCNLTAVDTKAFGESWQFVMKRHSILRSAFYHDAFTVSLQCVYKDVELPVEVLDYRLLWA